MKSNAYINRFTRSTQNERFKQRPICLTRSAQAVPLIFIPSFEREVNDLANPETTKRSSILARGIAAAFVFLLVHILFIQTVQFEKYQAKVINQITTESNINAARGKIYDCNGALIATNITAYRVFISPRAISSAEKRTKLDGVLFKKRFGMSAAEVESGLTHTEFVAKGLSQILDVDYEDVLKQTTYTYYLDRTVAREVDADTANKVRAFISANSLEDEIFLEAINIRYYPYSSLASSVIGFTTDDGNGVYGLELQYNKELSGTDGKYVTARASNGSEMPSEYEKYIPAIDGYNISTTIDVTMQAALEEQLKITLGESEAVNRACGIIIDVETFAIKAMATVPSFDLNEPYVLDEYFNLELNAPGYPEDSEEYKKLKHDLLEKMWSNKAVSESYIPGSTFKIITTAMALSEKVVTPDTHYYCNGSEVISGQRIHCYKLEGHGDISQGRGLQQSCNVVFMGTGLKLGMASFEKYFGAFGYTSKTGIDLPGEAGSIFNLQSTLDLAIYAFGQNFNVTPLQQICAIAAVANGGNLMTPYLVSSVKDNNGNVIYNHNPEVKRQVVSADICETVAKILEEGVSGDGGARNAYVAGYRVAAKTGTSEKKDSSNIPIDVERYVVSTAGFAPADDPKLAILIMVDEPTKAPLYGSTIAAPYVGKLFEQILPNVEGVEPEYTEEEAKSLSITTPDYSSAKWWSPSTAKNYAEKLGFEVEIVGSGSVVTSQIPAAGTMVLKSSAKLILYTGNEEPQNTIKVPDVTGKTAAAANQTLINSGFNIKIEGSKYYHEGGAATVESQFPAAGEMVPAGTVITVNFGYYQDRDIE